MQVFFPQNLVLLELSTTSVIDVHDSSLYVIIIFDVSTFAQFFFAICFSALNFFLVINGVKEKRNVGIFALKLVFVIPAG